MNRSAIDRHINRCRGEAFGRSSLQLNEDTYIQMLRPAPADRLYVPISLPHMAKSTIDVGAKHLGDHLGNSTKILISKCLALPLQIAYMYQFLSHTWQNQRSM